VAISRISAHITTAWRGRGQRSVSGGVRVAVVAAGSGNQCHHACRGEVVGGRGWQPSRPLRAANGLRDRRASFTEHARSRSSRSARLSTPRSPRRVLADPSRGWAVVHGLLRGCAPNRHESVGLLPKLGICSVEAAEHNQVMAEETYEVLRWMGFYLDRFWPLSFVKPRAGGSGSFDCRLHGSFANPMSYGGLTCRPP